MIRERGPRYLVTADIERATYAAKYEDTADAAEATFDRYAADGHKNARVHLPDVPGLDIDLRKYGRDRAEALRVAEEKTSILRAAVLRAIEAGRSEAEVARSAGIDRGTVRDWLGKPRKTEVAQ